jgi:hypothetical protein
MSESSTKRPPHTPATGSARTGDAAAAATEAASAAVPAPPAQPLPGAANPLPMPNPVALADVFAHGAEAYADEMAELMQTGFATATDTAKAMLGAKTLTEAFEINAGFVRKSLDTIVASSIRLTDITARLAEGSLKPLMPAL